jgi:polynucleotide 5'-kinase involved in rRNA processing
LFRCFVLPLTKPCRPPLACHHATRAQGWKPLLVDLDLGQGMFTAPGTLSATLVERPVEPVEGVPLDAPLIYYYGAATPQENPEHFTFLQKQLAKVGARLCGA